MEMIAHLQHQYKKILCMYLCQKMNYVCCARVFTKHFTDCPHEWWARLCVTFCYMTWLLRVKQTNYIIHLIIYAFFNCAQADKYCYYWSTCSALSMTIHTVYGRPGNNKVSVSWCRSEGGRFHLDCVILNILCFNFDTILAHCKILHGYL